MRLRRRRQPRERIDPFTVGEPWRHHLRTALQAQARYDQAVASVAGGPLRERLEEVGRRVEEATWECWRVAQRGEALDRSVAALDVSGLRARLDERTGSPVPTVGVDDPVAASLRAQLSSAERLRAAVTDAQERLGLLEVRLGEAVANAVALAVLAAGAADAGSLGADVDLVVEDLAALRAAFGEGEGLGR